MKVSLNSIKFMNQRYGCAGDPAAAGVPELIVKIGAQLGAIEEVIELGKRYEGIPIVRVVSCIQHPNADRLHLCKVDDGKQIPDIERDEDGYVQVVCGAPNVHEGMLAVWLPPGSTVPATYDDAEPFVLEARELRGQMSNGMMASPRELAIGDSHEGILEVDKEVAPGASFAETYELAGDVVVDIENKMFTHRPDCFGFLGVARELAGIQGQAFTSPEWYRPDVPFPGIEAEPLPLTIRNELPELVPRFTAVVMRDVKPGPSPVWLQVELAKVGQRSINDIVDYTNFFMLETGQPLHAYDYDKVKALSGGEASIVVRNPKPGEKITLLNSKTIEPRSEAIMIATDKRLIGVGGVMGGGETEVDETTTNIILECATFDMYSIRRTSMAHGLFTDAVTRFNKGQSPLQNLAVLAKICNEIRQLPGGKVASQLLDDNHLEPTVMTRQSLHPPVTVATAFVNERLGLNLSVEAMKSLLENVEFKVTASGDELTVTAPFWRTDIELREDVVEEVGRLYGFDKLPLKLPRRDLTPALKDQLLEFKNQIRQVLSRAGANEILSYSFVHGNLLEKVSQDTAMAYRISNALSPELQYYRLGLTPSLLDKVHANLKAGYEAFALFELGKVHSRTWLDEQELPGEVDRLAVVVAAGPKQAGKYAGAPYYMGRRYLEDLLGALHLSEDLNFEAFDPRGMDNMARYYQPGRTAVIKLGDEQIGLIGEYRAPVRQALKLPDFCVGFELDLASLMAAPQTSAAYNPLSRFPKVEQDISLKVPADTLYGRLAAYIRHTCQAYRPTNSLLTIQPLDIYQRSDDPTHKQMTFRLLITSYERTLTAAEINTLLDKVATAAKDEFGAERL